jgi:hypothetical protein
MRLGPVPRQTALSGLRAVHSVCTDLGKRELSALQSRLLSGIQEFLLSSDFPSSQLVDISPEELTHSVTELEFRERILRACIIAACIDGTMDRVALAHVEAYARALGVDRAPVNAAWRLANRNLIRARLAIIRRSLPGVKVRQTIREQGLLAMIKQFFPLAGIELPKVTARYRTLADYPEGTLGREFIEYLRRNQFPLPGEKHAGPEIIVLHDCLHILGDYGTTAAEEIEVASFQAGCQFQDPIYGLLFGLAQYHLDIQMAPVAPAQALHADPERMIAAFARGCAVTRDMWVDFDPWEHFGKPVGELRAELGVPSKACG